MTSLTNAEKYLKNRISAINISRKNLCEKYNKTQIEVVEIDNQIKSLINKIDMAYEIFSPKTNESSFNRKEIKDLETKKVVILQEGISLHKEIIELEAEIKEIDTALAEISSSGSDDYIISSSANTEKDLSFADNPNITSLYDPDIIDKLRFCLKIFDLDVRRVKLELEELLRNTTYNK